MKEIIITSMEEGQRLDRILKKYLSRASAGFLYKMLRKKNITLNGKKAAGKEKLVQGDTIRIYFSEETLEKFISLRKPSGYPCIDLDIVYEDSRILLINKPAGMLTQKASPQDVSLNEYAIGYLLESGAVTEESLGSFRPSVCNRLDRNTSGIVAVGKSVTALQELSGMFRERTIHKYYQTLVAGRLEEEKTIEAYLVKDGRTNQVRIFREEPERTSSAQEQSAWDQTASMKEQSAWDQTASVKEQNAWDQTASTQRQNVRNRIDGAQRIRTRYSPIDFRTVPGFGEDLTLLEVELITGRSHQIRAHLASENHPVIGDPKYGNKRWNAYFRKEYGLCSQLLHAGRIVFPETDKALGYLSGREFTARLPKLFERVLRDTDPGSGPRA